MVVHSFSCSIIERERQVKGKDGGRENTEDSMVA
jgi:hypothetical protein